MFPKVNSALQGVNHIKELCYAISGQSLPEQSYLPKLLLCNRKLVIDYFYDKLMRGEYDLLKT